MQIWKDIRLTIGFKESEVRALFDSGSSFIVMGYRTGYYNMLEYARRQWKPGE